jgi:hypothetical protein
MRASFIYCLFSIVYLRNEGEVPSYFPVQICRRGNSCPVTTQLNFRNFSFAEEALSGIVLGYNIKN